MTLEEQAEFVAVELLGWRKARNGQWAAEYGWTGSAPHLHLLTGNGMLEIIEAMRARDWNIRIDWFSGIRVQFVKLAMIAESDGNADTLPEAVLRAAYAALQND